MRPNSKKWAEMLSFEPDGKPIRLSRTFTSLKSGCPAWLRGPFNIAPKQEMLGFYSLNLQLWKVLQLDTYIKFKKRKKKSNKEPLAWKCWQLKLPPGSLQPLLAVALQANVAKLPATAYRWEIRQAGTTAGTQWDLLPSLERMRTRFIVFSSARPPYYHMNGRVSRRPDTGLATEPQAFGRKRKHLCYSERGEGGGMKNRRWQSFDCWATMGLKLWEHTKRFVRKERKLYHEIRRKHVLKWLLNMNHGITAKMDFWRQSQLGKTKKKTWNKEGRMKWTTEHWHYSRGSRTENSQVATDAGENNKGLVWERKTKIDTGRKNSQSTDKWINRF